MEQRDTSIMFCDHCGNEIANEAIVCPACGSLTGNNVQYTQPATYQMQKGPQDDFSKFGGPPLYQNGYQSVPPPNYVPLVPPQVPGYAPSSYPPAYPPGNVTIIQNSGNEASIAAEIILSLFGLFGVGWLIGGETTVGIILLVCSVFIYWPVMILGTLFTFGVGLICLGPLAIGAIILNAILCSSTLKRRAARVTMIHSTPPPPTMQPPYQ